MRMKKEGWCPWGLVRDKFFLIKEVNLREVSLEKSRRLGGKGKNKGNLFLLEERIRRVGWVGQVGGRKK